MKEVKLPSGAILKITLAPFSDAKALHQAILEEIKQIELSGKTDLTNMFKNIACVAFSSKKIESCIEICLKRCTYDFGKGDLKIDSHTFEPLAHREDYIAVCTAVIEENILPFMKSLYAEFQRFMSKLPSIQS